MVQGVEELTNINLKDPPARHLHRLALHNSQRLMRRTSRPKAVRAVEKTLLIDGLQYHGHGSLEHFILEGGNADGSRLRTIAFRDVHPANWWRHVAAGMSAFKQRAEVALQIARVLLGHLPVHAGG